MSILDKIKEEAKKSGQSKGKFIFFKEGEKRRVRFLTDMDDGMEIPFHDSFEKGINVPCQELFGKDCEYCGNDELRTRSLYAWSVYDYESKEVKILMQAVNNCTAVPAIMALYETYATLLDRDLVITRSGKGQNTTYAVVPMDKNKFRNEKAKALSEKSILKYLNQAYPDPNADEDDDDDEDEKPAKTHTKAKKCPADDDDEELPFKGGKTMRKPKPAVDDDDEEEGDDEVDYSSMSARELYKLCKERDLEALPKKPEKYYIKLLEEYDKTQEDWGDAEDDDDEDWEDDEE